MGDLFQSDDVKRLLKNRFVVILGDSIQRGIYKDLVKYVQVNAVLDESQLRKKLEESHCGDAVHEGHQLTNAKTYREVRQFQSDHHLIRFYFLTRCFGEYFESVLMDLIEGPEPDLLIMNSTLWDVTRYGGTGMEEFQRNLQLTFHCLTKLLPPHTLILWLTALPVSSEMKGGFLLPEINFLKQTLRLDILEANFFATQVAEDYGIDVLDMHYFFRNNTHMRVGDGVHWNATAHRKISNIILAHVSKAWGKKLPGRDRKHNMFASPLDAQRSATDSVESYMGVAAGPLPWQIDADLQSKKEQKKEDSGISFSANDLLDLDLELAQSSSKKEAEAKKKEDSGISFNPSDLLDLDLALAKPKQETKKKEDSAISFNPSELLDLDLEISKPKKDTKNDTKKKEDTGITFDASDLLGLDLELEQKKEPPKSTGISFDPSEMMDLDLEVSGKKETQSNGVVKSEEVKDDLDWLFSGSNTSASKSGSTNNSSNRYKPY